MYSHKRSFTGQSSRSLAALFDAPFLISGIIIAGLFSILHSALTFVKLPNHIRSLPTPLQNMGPELLAETLKKNTHIFDYQLIMTQWIGLVLPFIVFAMAIRWTLASLRVSVQRTVATATILAFYFFSTMTVALENTDWTPGNLLVQLFSPLGSGVFRSLRAILCLSLFVACLMTLTRNATSKLNRNMRWTTVLVGVVAFVLFDYARSKSERTIHSSFLRSPASTKFIFVLPGLTPLDVQQSLRSETLVKLRQQLNSFQEVHPSTPSPLGQFVTTTLGIEPNIHSIRHDFTDPEMLAPTWKLITNKSFPKGHQTFAFAVGGPSPLQALVTSDTPGQRCGQSPGVLAAVGHFQASVLPYALTPRILEPYLNEELICSNRFLSLQQHLAQTYETITQQLHKEGPKTFLIWVSSDLKNQAESEKLQDASSRFFYETLRMHQQFLESTSLMRFHQTFVIGLSKKPEQTTAFVRFDGQSESQLTDITLDSPGQRAQISLADLLQNQQFQTEKDSPFFYSEFGSTDGGIGVGTLAPIVKQKGRSGDLKSEFIVNPDQMRKLIVNSKRYVICQKVTSADGQRMLVKVSLNLRATENRLPQLTYEEFKNDKLPAPENVMDLDGCLQNARELLNASVAKDVSLRDGSTFRTLLTGLPVKSIKMSSDSIEPENATEEEALDRSTSAVPNTPEEELEE